MSSRLFNRQVLQQVRRHQASQVASGVVAFFDRVCAVRISKHRELFVVLDQFVDQHLAGLVVAVVVTRAVDEQQVAFEVLGEIHRGAVAVAFEIVARQAHVSFLVDRVVVALVRHRCDRDARVIQVRVFEHGLQR